MEKSKFAMYKGYPLVRKGKEIYYGNMSDEYVCMISIVSTHKVKDLEIADKIKVMLLHTAAENDAGSMILRNSDRDNLYDALEVSHNWLIKTQ
ncbi:MAG: hypothetical protein LBR74_08040 [Eubacterium sp.]|jgi:hypothetical protein|nr:hypothetical protein [Eubacterium sp.]